MRLHQLSLFLENQPGRLRRPCQVLADAGLDIVTLSLADTRDYGILRLVVKDWEQARAVLEAAGCVVNVTEVLAIDVDDRPGGLLAILSLLEQADLAIEYMYAFPGGSPEARATMIFRFEDPDAAIALLTAQGVNVVGHNELFSRVKR